MTTYEVGIVGAGVHGAAAAFHLASRGMSVIVFDKDTPAGGPTGRSSAVCRAYYTNPFLAGVARESLDFFADFQKHTGRSAGFVRQGIYFLHPPEHGAEVRASVEHLNAIGTVTELLEPAALAERLPSFDLEGIGIAAFEEGAGYADPHATTDGLLRRAIELGAELRQHHGVVQIQRAPEGGGGALVTDAGGRFICERILIAAGPWTRSLASQVGADLPLTVERHVVVSFRWGAADPVPAHGDIPGGYYFRPEGDELFIAGPLHAGPQVDPDRFPEELTAEDIEPLSAAIMRRVPALERAGFQGGWVSLYDVSPDWQPVIGKIAPGIFVDAGTSGHGFKLAPGLGRHVADLVSGHPAPELAEFGPTRFERGAALRAGFGEARILG